MGSFENRVFLATCEDIRNWGGRSTTLINTLEKSDVIFLIKRKDESLTNSQNNLISEMKKKTDLKIIEKDDENSAVIGLKILLEYLSKDENRKVKKVYIIGPSLKCMEEDRKKIEELAGSLLFHHSFRVKQIRKTNPEPQEEHVQMLIEEVLQSTNNIDPKESNGPEKKKEEKNRNNKVISKNKSDQKAINTTAKSEDAKSTVERQIFGGNRKTKEYEEYHSQLEDIKALLILELQNRLQKHIKKELFATKETIVLSEKQLMTFILLILRSKSVEEFNDSWAVSEHEPNIELKEAMYVRILAEVQYYEKVSYLLFEEDNW